MGKPAKDLVERVGGMGRPPGRIKSGHSQKRSFLDFNSKSDFPI